MWNCNCKPNRDSDLEPKEEFVQKRIALLLVLLALLIACTNPNNAVNSNWDEATFETANWN